MHGHKGVKASCPQGTLGYLVLLECEMHKGEVARKEKRWKVGPRPWRSLSELRSEALECLSAQRGTDQIVASVHDLSVWKSYSFALWRKDWALRGQGEPGSGLWKARMSSFLSVGFLTFYKVILHGNRV